MVKVLRQFNFTHPDGRQEMFYPGERDMPADVANHWFAKANTDQADDANPAPGSDAWNERERLRRLNRLVEENERAEPEKTDAHEERKALDDRERDDAAQREFASRRPLRVS